MNERGALTGYKPPTTPYSIRQKKRDTIKKTDKISDSTTDQQQDNTEIYKDKETVNRQYEWVREAVIPAADSISPHSHFIIDKHT